MNKLPEMISTKDLLYISDMFNWHIVVAKKFELYALHITDKDCLKKVNDLCTLHYKICEDLIDLLGSGTE